MEERKGISFDTKEITVLAHELYLKLGVMKGVSESIALILPKEQKELGELLKRSSNELELPINIFIHLIEESKELVNPFSPLNEMNPEDSPFASNENEELTNSNAISEPTVQQPKNDTSAVDFIESSAVISNTGNPFGEDFVEGAVEDSVEEVTSTATDFSEVDVEPESNQILDATSQTITPIEEADNFVESAEESTEQSFQNYRGMLDETNQFDNSSLTNYQIDGAIGLTQPAKKILEQENVDIAKLNPDNYTELTSNDEAVVPVTPISDELENVDVSDNLETANGLVVEERSNDELGQVEVPSDEMPPTTEVLYAEDSPEDYEDGPTDEDYEDGPTDEDYNNLEDGPTDEDYNNYENAPTDNGTV